MDFLPIRERNPGRYSRLPYIPINRNRTTIRKPVDNKTDKKVVTRTFSDPYTIPATPEDIGDRYYSTEHTDVPKPGVEAIKEMIKKDVSEFRGSAPQQFMKWFTLRDIRSIPPIVKAAGGSPEWYKSMYGDIDPRNYKEIMEHINMKVARANGLINSMSIKIVRDRSTNAELYDYIIDETAKWLHSNDINYIDFVDGQLKILGKKYNELEREKMERKNMGNEEVRQKTIEELRYLHDRLLSKLDSIKENITDVMRRKPNIKVSGLKRMGKDMDRIEREIQKLRDRLENFNDNIDGLEKSFKEVKNLHEDAYAVLRFEDLYKRVENKGDRLMDDIIEMQDYIYTLLEKTELKTEISEAAFKDATDELTRLEEELKNLTENIQPGGEESKDPCNDITPGQGRRLLETGADGIACNYRPRAKNVIPFDFRDSLVPPRGVENFNDGRVRTMVDNTGISRSMWVILAAVAQEAYSTRKQAFITYQGNNFLLNRGLSTDLMAVYSGKNDRGLDTIILGFSGTNIKGSIFTGKNFLTDVANDLMIASGGTPVTLVNTINDDLQKILGQSMGKAVYVVGHSLAGTALYSIAKRWGYMYPRALFIGFNMGSSPMGLFNPNNVPTKKFISCVITNDIVSANAPQKDYSFNPLLKYNAHAMDQFIDIFKGD